MRFIRAPLVPEPVDYLTARHIAFLGGGISNCPDWQAYIENKLVAVEGLDNVFILNPRRENFDTSDPSVSVAQIRWEYAELENANILVFWFPKETLCPITLYELGKAVGQYKWGKAAGSIIVGCDPEYARRFDLEVQLDLIMGGYKLVYSLDDLADKLIKELKL